MAFAPARGKEASRKDRRLQLVNSAVFAQLHKGFDTKILAVFNFKHPRTRNDAGTQEAVPTLVKIYSYADGLAEAEPLSLRENPVPAEHLPAATLLDRTMFSERQRYMLMLMADSSIWEGNDRFWRGGCGISWKSVLEARIRFGEAFKAGNLELAWKVAHRFASELLHLEESDAEQNSFWEMDVLIQEAQRPARACLESRLPEHAYVVRDRALDPGGAKYRQSNATCIAGEWVHYRLFDDGSITFDPEQSGQPSAVAARKQPRDHKQIPELLSDPDEMVFFARFPISMEVAMKNSPPLKHNDRAQHASGMSREIPQSDGDFTGDAEKEIKKRRKKKKKAKKPSETFVAEAETGQVEEVLDEAQARQFMMPQETALQAQPNPEASNQATIVSEITRESLHQYFDEIYSDSVYTPSSSTPGRNRAAKPQESSAATCTEDSCFSSDRQGSSPSHPSGAMTPRSEDEPDAGNLPDGAKLEAIFAGERNVKINHYTSDLRVSPTESRASSLTCSPPSLKSKRNETKAKGAKERAARIEENSHFAKSNPWIEKEGEVVFVYCTWIGLSDAKRGVRELANTFGEEWVKKGIVLYSTHEGWELA